MLIAPSVLSADFSMLGSEIARMDKAGADMIHLDVMDGHFVPNISFGAPVITTVRGYTKLPFDTHLMITKPQQYIGDFLKAGSDMITFHVEAEGSPVQIIEMIREGGAKPAISVKPNTPIETIYPYLKDLYMVLIMTVEPGFGGQSFMEPMMEKVRKLKAKVKEMGLNTLIQVDGGINLQTIHTCKEAGVDVCVAGTSVFKAEDAAQAIAGLKSAAEGR